jgi:hypothetical protein
VGESYPKNVYFGDTHLHTSNSFDGGFINYNVGPEEAFRFARGEEITASNGMRIKLNRPLDFLVVSDHAEYLGLTPGLRNSDPILLKTKYGRKWHDLLKGTYEEGYEAAMEAISSVAYRDEKIKNEDFTRSVWQANNKTADLFDDPGNFTAFIGFEWTSTPGGNNLHRVLIFKEGAEKANRILPLSTFDTEDPEELWKYMADYEKLTGGNVLAIPHNGNVSNGLMFAVENFSGQPLTREYAATRIKWEPIYEMTQMKGDGEAHPALSPNDEFADYETWDKGNLPGTAAKKMEMLQYEYARSALELGLKLEQELGINPFKFGMIGSTDSHTGLATADSDNNWGKHSGMEPKPDRWAYKVLESPVDASLTTFAWETAASGYAAVWARSNTREALFEAMERKEVYATTGPRITVRFFGGWDFRPEDAVRPDAVETGYEKGVPMGGDLWRTEGKKAPTFMVGALKDPEGAYLDRVQIIKGWLDGNGELQEAVYDVAVSDDRVIGSDGRCRTAVGSTVDVANATYTNTIGDAQLKGFWKDPDFDPTQRAFYYVRVIEIPTPRWTAYDAKYFNVKMPDEVPMTTQERAYTSPIWYTP